ncbi:uncharacterized protein [Drosophila tropicalis]|uniref:uncharacterized protein n=1 Tax=Drosophila tropicalis TaxID=46794 RepID=UPI0035AB8D5A
MSQPPQRRNLQYRWAGEGGRNPQDVEQQEEVIILITPETMRLFIRNVYFVAIVFVMLSAITWIVASGTQFSVTQAWTVPAYVWIICAFVCMSILCCCPMTRFIFPINWIITVLLVIFITIYGMYLQESVPFSALLVSLAIAFVLMILLHVCGAFCPQILLPNLICTGCTVLLGFVVLFVLGIIYLVNKRLDILLGFCVLLFIMVIVLVPFHAQLIHGRFEFVPIHDALGCAENFYVHFVLLLYCLCYFYAFDNYYLL